MFRRDQSMTDFLKCPACGVSIAVDPGDVNRPRQCEKCGGLIPPGSSDWNPYGPPSAAVGQADGGQFVALEVPSTVFGKFGLAWRLLFENFSLYALIMLTVWLPANIAIAYFLSNAPPGREVMLSFQLNSMMNGGFGPISSGALIFAVAMRMEGQKVGYREAMGVGFRNWGRLFIANFYAGIITTLGYVALIVPGILLSVRYALIDPAVIFERPTAPRSRSTELTSGRRWPIFFAGVLFFTLFGLCTYAIAVVVALVQERLEWLDQFWVGIAVDCVFSVFESLFTLVIVLFYLEARAQEASKPVEPMDDFGIQMQDVGDPLRRLRDPSLLGYES